MELDDLMDVPTGKIAAPTVTLPKVGLVNQDVLVLGCPVGSYMCQGLNSHYFHIIGDGLYTHYKDSY